MQSMEIINASQTVKVVAGNTAVGNQDSLRVVNLHPIIYRLEEETSSTDAHKGVQSQGDNFHTEEKASSTQEATQEATQAKMSTVSPHTEQTSFEEEWMLSGGDFEEGVFLQSPHIRSSVYQKATIEEVLGNSSSIVPTAYEGVKEQISLTENPGFQAFVLLLAAAYGLLLYDHAADIRSLFSRILRSTTKVKGGIEEIRSNGFNRFIHTTTALGLLFCGVLTVKYGDTLIPSHLLEVIPFGAVLMLSLVVSIIAGGVIFVQWLFLKICAELTLSRKFVEQLQQIRQLYFSWTAVLVCPPLLLFALCPRGEATGWFLLIIIGLSLAGILYLKESITLFIHKKISILHWFLYLCTVEILPISFLWSIFTK